ncbi:hypothetical protein JOM56_001874 [Amanita muscaria]
MHASSSMPTLPTTIPVTGIFIHPSLCTNMHIDIESRTNNATPMGIAAAVKEVRQRVATKVSFRLVPPIIANEMKQESFPAVPATKPLPSVEQGGLTVLFRPSNEQEHRILNCKNKLQFSESLLHVVHSPSHPSEPIADSTIQAMQRELAQRFEEEPRAHRVSERRLDEKMAELQRMMMMITPLHIRALLNQARQQILTTLYFGGTWEDLRQQMETAGQSLVKHICANRHVKLNPEAVQFLCFNNHPCQSDNDAAHKAT